MRLGLLFLVLVLGAGAQGVSVQWTEDVPAAEARALAEDKPILWYFTGSDWCGYCKKLKSDVFSVEAVAQTMNDSFVLIYADYPRVTQQDPEIRKQNRNLLRRFQGLIPGYPTMVFTLPDGQPYAKVSGAGFTAAQFRQTLEDTRRGATAMQALLARAASGFGEPKLSALTELFRYLGEANIPASFYSSQAQELGAAAKAMAADPSLDGGEKATLYLVQAMAALYLGDLPGAKVLMAEADAVTSAPYQTTLQKASLLREVGELGDAIVAYEAAIGFATDPQQIHAAYYLKAVTEFQAGLFEPAVKSAESAIQASPNGSYRDLALTYIVLAHLRSGDIPAAIAATDEAIKHITAVPALQQVYYFRGMAQLQGGDQGEALKSFKTGLLLAPASTLADRLRAQIQILEASLEEPTEPSES